MIKNKNFLLVISKFPPEYSGPGVRIPRLYKCLENQGHDINLKILCNGIEHTKNETYDHDGFGVRRVTAGIFYKIFSFLPQKISHFLTYNIEFLKTFFTLLFYKNIDFLHVAGHSGGTAAALLWAKIRKIPVLMELVNATATPYQKIFSVFKVTISESSKVAFLTEKQSKPFDKKFKSNGWIKPNPVDTEKFKFSGDKVDSKEKIILSIAKFMPRKNQIFLIEVLKYLPDNFKLTMAGPKIKQGRFFQRDHEYFENIISLIEKYNFHDRVNIIQDYVEADEYMKTADVYVMPAWDEGLGTPMIEAMACGVPVVANAAEPAFQEWVEHGNNGFMVSLDDVQGWAEFIVRAADIDQDQRLRISKSIENKAGQKKIFSEYESIISDLIKI